jgi:hypothetical protein
MLQDFPLGKVWQGQQILGHLHEMQRNYQGHISTHLFTRYSLYTADRQVYGKEPGKSKIEPVIILTHPESRSVSGVWPTTTVTGIFQANCNGY